MGNVSVHFVPKLDEPSFTYVAPPDAGVTDGGDAALDATLPDVMSADAGDAMVGDGGAYGYMLNTPTFPTRVDGSVPAHGANYASIALGVVNPAQVDIGLTWVEQCNQATSAVFFARVRWDGNMQTFTSSTPIQVSPMGVRADAPSIVYVDHGFVRPGLMRNGATADRDGGFYVTYIDHGQTMTKVRLRRIAQFDGQLIPEQPIDITDPTVNVTVSSPHLYSLGSSAEPVSFVYGSNSGMQPGLIGGQLVCRAPQ
jgi:hypothetical protein